MEQNISLRQRVLEVLMKNPNEPLKNSAIADELGMDVKKVSNALWGLKSDRDTHVYSVAQGVHMYDPPQSMPKLERTIAQAVGVFEEPEAEENPEDGRYFTQVGVAENGDIIITRDSDARVYRATPV